jgi:hypothetical protein
MIIKIFYQRYELTRKMKRPAEGVLLAIGTNPEEFLDMLYAFDLNRKAQSLDFRQAFIVSGPTPL